MFAAFGPKKSMQVYNRGLRRRAPTMLDGDQDRLRLLYSLMFSLPGTPVLFYGEEIGMGENLAADQRLAVRTPMQWTGGRNGGFSDARAADLVSPVVRGGVRPEGRSTSEQQRSDPESMHAFVRSLMRAYRECPELGWGAFSAARLRPAAASWPTGAPGRTAAVVALHNLADRPVSATVTLPEGVGPVRLAEPLGDVRLETDRQGRLDVRLGRYGHLLAAASSP